MLHFFKSLNLNALNLNALRLNDQGPIKVWDLWKDTLKAVIGVYKEGSS